MHCWLLCHWSAGVQVFWRNAGVVHRLGWSNGLKWSSVITEIVHRDLQMQVHVGYCSVQLLLFFFLFSMKVFQRKKEAFFSEVWICISQCFICCGRTLKSFFCIGDIEAVPVSAAQCYDDQLLWMLSVGVANDLRVWGSLQLEDSQCSFWKYCDPKNCWEAMLVCTFLVCVHKNPT